MFHHVSTLERSQDSSRRLEREQKHVHKLRRVNKALRSKVHRLQHALQRTQAKLVEKENAEDDYACLEIQRARKGKGKHLTLQGSFALAIRRNLSNIATADIGAVLLQDISRYTVTRSECRAGNSLVASARLWYNYVYGEITTGGNDSFSLVVNCFKEDATNSNILKGAKLAGLILRSGFLKESESMADNGFQSSCADWRFEDWFEEIVRVADVLPVDGSTSEATVSQTLKQLECLGCISWKKVQSDTALQRWLVCCRYVFCLFIFSLSSCQIFSPLFAKHCRIVEY